MCWLLMLSCCCCCMETVYTWSFLNLPRKLPDIQVSYKISTCHTRSIYIYIHLLMLQIFHSPNMSESETQHFSPTTRGDVDVVNDIILWRRKKLSGMVLVIATAMWVVLEIYQFNFLTVASWILMSIVGSVFLWANFLRLLGKEPPDMSDLEMTEETAIEMVNSIRVWIEEGMRWLFQVSAEREWYVFVGSVASLWLLSVIGSYFDLLTLLYIGIVMGMTVPVIYIKYEDKIKRCMEGKKVQCIRFYDMVDEKVISKMKSKNVKVKKEKKVE